MAAVLVLELVVVFALFGALVPRVRDSVIVSVRYHQRLCSWRVRAAVMVKVAVVVFRFRRARVPPIIDAVIVRVGQRVRLEVRVNSVRTAVRILEPVPILFSVRALVLFVGDAVPVGVIKRVAVVRAAVLVVDAVERLWLVGASVQVVREPVAVGVGRAPAVVLVQVGAAVLVLELVVGLFYGRAEVDVVLHAVTVRVIPRHKVRRTPVYLAVILGVIVLLEVGAEIRDVRNAVTVSVDVAGRHGPVWDHAG